MKPFSADPVLILALPAFHLFFFFISSILYGSAGFFHRLALFVEWLTLFKCTFMLPFASMVAVSPRNATTLPRMRTVWLVKESRYLALTRGVASEAMVVVSDSPRVIRLSANVNKWEYLQVLKC